MEHPDLTPAFNNSNTYRQQKTDGCPLVVKGDNGKSPLNEGLTRKIIYKWRIVHCHVWLEYHMKS